MAVLLAGFALVILVALVTALISLERRGDGIVTVAAILGFVVVEVGLYGSQNGIIGGIFNPTIGARSIRVYEVLIVLALAARLYVRGIPRVVSPALFAWAAFFIWVFASAVMGRLDGNPVAAITTQAKGAVYLGALVLAAGVPIEDYFERRPMKVVAIVAAALATLLGVSALLNIRLAASLPGLPVPQSVNGETAFVPPPPRRSSPASRSVSLPTPCANSRQGRGSSWRRFHSPLSASFPISVPRCSGSALRSACSSPSFSCGFRGSA
jgi:hypothetical protein